MAIKMRREPAPPIRSIARRWTSRLKWAVARRPTYARTEALSYRWRSFPNIAGKRDAAMRLSAFGRKEAEAPLSFPKCELDLPASHHANRVRHIGSGQPCGSKKRPASNSPSGQRRPPAPVPMRTLGIFFRPKSGINHHRHHRFCHCHHHCHCHCP